MNTEDTQQETLSTLYKVELEVMVKDFMSQKTGDSKQTFEINCDSINEFQDKVWASVEQHIEKPVIFNDITQTYEWSDQDLTSQDLDKFVLFQDKVCKRSYEVFAITTKLLQAWKNKKGLVCFVHVYGTILKKKAQYELAFRQVIQPGIVDRAGAVSNIEVFNCIEKLKDLHPDLIGTEASWLRWANWIQKQSGHERENLMLKDPPSIKPNLLALFKVARNEPERMHEVRNDIQIGKRVNGAVAESLPEIEEEIDELIDHFKSGLHRVERIKTRLQCLRTQVLTTDNLLDGFSEALGPEEDEFSVELVRGIENIEDVHQYDVDSEVMNICL